MSPVVQTPNRVAFPFLSFSPVVPFFPPRHYTHDAYLDQTQHPTQWCQPAPAVRFLGDKAIEMAS